MCNPQESAYEYRPDDSESVAEDWLRLITETVYHSEDFVIVSDWTVSRDFQGEWSFYRGKTFLTNVPTRGDLRRLCWAFGIPIEV